jgi:hypothetical protein
MVKKSGKNRSVRGENWVWIKQVKCPRKSAFCRRLADGQRHRTKRNAIAAFGKAERFCHEKPEGGNLQDNVLFPLALNERYLCRAHRTLAGLQADHFRS